MNRLRPIHLFFLSPAQAMVTLMLTAPAFYVFWLSFTVSDFGQNPQFVGWKNYAVILNDRYFWTATWNTFLVVNAVVYLELVLATLIAMVVASMKRGRTLMFAIILVPYGISEVVGVLSWRFLADPSIGLITNSLSAIGITFNWTLEPNAALALITTISVWHHLPFSFVILYAAIISVPDELYEAARVDGATKWQEFWKITLPLIIPAALLAIIFRYVFAFRMFTEVWLVTQGGPIRLTEVLGTYLYRTGFRYSDFGGAAATGWLMVLGSLLLASLYIRAIYKSAFKNA